MRKILNEGEGYKIRATRKSVGTFEVVAIDWEHPNYGYFADAMLWIWSPHLDKWMPIPIVKWSREYETLQGFLEDYPAFRELFEIQILPCDNNRIDESNSSKVCGFLRLISPNE